MDSLTSVILDIVVAATFALATTANAANTGPIDGALVQKTVVCNDLLYKEAALVRRIKITNNIRDTKLSKWEKKLEEDLRAPAIEKALFAVEMADRAEKPSTALLESMRLRQLNECGDFE